MILVRIFYTWPATALAWLAIQWRIAWANAGCKGCNARRTATKVYVERYVDALRRGKLGGS